jgi:hypothetical protein
MEEKASERQATGFYERVLSVGIAMLNSRMQMNFDRVKKDAYLSKCRHRQSQEQGGREAARECVDDMSSRCLNQGDRTSNSSFANFLPRGF